MSFYVYIFVRYKTKTLLRSTWKLGVFEALRLFFDVTIRLTFLSTVNLMYSVSHLFMMHTGDKDYVNFYVLCRVNFFRSPSWHWNRFFQRKRQLKRRGFFLKRNREIMQGVCIRVHKLPHPWRVNASYLPQCIVFWRSSYNKQFQTLLKE